MSRKIGLCDIHFDPDIEGEIDFDFFDDGVDDELDAVQMSGTDDDDDGGGHRSPTSKTVTPIISGKGAAINGKSDEGGQRRRPRQRREPGEDDLSPPSPTRMSYHPGVNRVGRSLVEDASARTVREQLQLNLMSDCLDFEQVPCPLKRDDDASSQGGGVRNLTALASLAIDTALGDRLGDHVDHHRQQQDQQATMERSLTPKELLRVTATELRFGSPRSSDSGSDSASDLYSLTDSLDEDNSSDQASSDSEITDVSPLSSANMSPLPESPRRRTPEPKRSSQKFGSFSPRPGLSGRGRRSISAAGLQCCNGGPKSTVVVGDVVAPPSKETSVDLKLLAKAILELEEERKERKTSSSTAERYSSERDIGAAAVRSRSSSMLSHESSGRMSNSGRKNLSFTNDEVRRIEQENKRLLRRIIDSHKSRRSSQPPPITGKLASSAVNRMRELKKIEAENLAMLKRLQAAKPTKELSRDFLLKAGSRSGGGGGSTCGGSMQCGACATPMSSPSSSQSGSSSQPSARGRHGGGGGRSLSTGSLTSTLASCSTSNRNYSGRSRSLKLPNAAVSTGFVGLGQQGPSAAAGGGGR